MAKKLLSLCALGLACAAAAPAADLQSVVNRAVAETRAEFANPPLQPEQLAVTLVDLRGAAPVRVHSRGDERFYPASVIKLFFLAHAHRQMEDGRLADTPELRRGLRDMIVDSYNEATSFVVDSLTGTSSGPELPAAEIGRAHV